MPVQVSGIGRVRVAPFQWADRDGDFRVDDAEMLQASDIVDEMQGVHIDYKELESLWDAGSYRWDQPSGRFVPVKNVITEIVD
jgi:hypothetical protein